MWYFSLFINVYNVVGGEDYAEINAETPNQLLVFNDANRRLSFNVTIISDNQLESREDFSLELMFDTFLGDPPAGVTLSPNVTTVTIEDDDIPGMCKRTLGRLLKLYAYRVSILSFSRDQMVE